MHKGRFWIVGSGDHRKALTVGEGTHVGVGVSVRKNTRIGARGTMGAGSVVVVDLPGGSVSALVHEVQL